MRTRVRSASTLLCAGAAVTGACFHDSYDLTMGTSSSAAASAATGTSVDLSGTGAPASSTSADTSSSGEPPLTSGSSSTTTGASATTGGAPPARCQAAPDLVACYDFDEPWPEGVLLDGSGAGLHGTLTDVAQVSRLTGGAAQTSLTSLIKVPDTSALASWVTWTQMLWIRPAALPAAAQRWGLVDRASDYGIFLHGTSGVQCKTGGHSLDSGYLPPPGAWTHVACVRDEMALELRINGKPIANVTLNAYTPVEGGGLTIANDDPTPVPEQAFLGELDEVMLWRAALSLGTLCAEAGLSC